MGPAGQKGGRIKLWVLVLIPASSIAGCFQPSPLEVLPEPEECNPLTCAATNSWLGNETKLLLATIRIHNQTVRIVDNRSFENYEPAQYSWNTSKAELTLRGVSPPANFSMAIEIADGQTRVLHVTQSRGFHIILNETQYRFFVLGSPRTLSVEHLILTPNCRAHIQGSDRNVTAESTYSIRLQRGDSILAKIEPTHPSAASCPNASVEIHYVGAWNRSDALQRPPG